MEREELTEVFISELKKVVAVHPGQEDMIRKILLNHDDNTKFYLLMPRYRTRTYLNHVYGKIFAE